MKKSAVYITALVIFITSAVIATDALSASKKPRMVIEPAVWDFGKVKEGKKISHAFTIKNTGKAKLVIESALENCECVSAAVSEMTVEPEKTTEIKVVFDTTDSRGPFEKTVQVLSNDPDTPMQTILIKGNIVP